MPRRISPPMKIGTKLNIPQIQIVESFAQGKDFNWVMNHVLHVPPEPDKASDPEGWREWKRTRDRAHRLIHRTCDHPDFLDYYNRYIMKVMGYHTFGKAVNKISEQIDDPNGWLANKAANDAIGLLKGPIAGVEDNTVTVRIEGMPELGEPDAGMEALEKPVDGMVVIGEPEPIEEERE